MSVPPVQPGQSYAATGTRPEPAAVAGHGGGQSVASTAAVTANAAPTPPLDPLMAAVAQALSAAAARQNGLAPLFANLEALLSRADLPEAVRNAAQGLSGLRLPDASLAGGALRQAVSRSGLFVEAVQARGLTPDVNIKSALQTLRTALEGLIEAGGIAGVAKTASPSATVSAPVTASAQMADAGVRQAVMLVLNDTEAVLAITPGASPAWPAALPSLTANLNALLAQPNLPDAIRNAAQALLALGLSGSSPDEVAGKAPGLAGMLPDALWSGTALTDAAIKVAMQNLRDTLKGFLGAGNAPADNRPAPLPPPFRGALPVAQAPVPATIGGAGLREAAMTLLAQTDAAIARHVMLQIASLPASQQPSHPQDDHTQRMVCDIPLLTPQGTMIVQVQIEREAPQRQAQVPVWSVRFAIDMEPIGPVRARVAQIAGKTSVTMVAEKPESAAALQKDIGSLKAALTQAALEPGDLHCLSHDQTKVTAPQGQFVNRAS